VYPIAPSELKDFIFIGIPASECQNPLITPLAGHELGHVVWRRQGTKQDFDPQIRREVLVQFKARWAEFNKLFGTHELERLETDLFLRSAWGQSLSVAQRQLEEIFCDFLGVYIFGKSFLHSFRYLLAPSLGHIRSVHYPSIRARAEYMQYAAREFGLEKIPDFAASFSEEEPRLSSENAFLVGVADQVTRTLHPKLIDLVRKYRGRAAHYTEGTGHERMATDSLRKLVPIAAVDSVSTIVNAGWNIRLDIDSWDILRDISDEADRRVEKLRVLRDLILKSFEVFEYRKRVARNATER
jgi:hypothetical protein